MNSNKVMKIMHGNKKQVKSLKHIRVIQLNKGNSSIDKYNDADIVTIGEVNVARVGNALKLIILIIMQNDCLSKVVTKQG